MWPKGETMKLITFAVPCYNSQDYMNKCIDSLLYGGDEVEIIIVNDGSSDRTAEIADEYARKYPNIVNVVHKVNGGHGSGVNKGMEFAAGLYYKVVDSDDWIDRTALNTLLNTIREHEEKGIAADLYITNYVYEKVYAGKRFVRSYEKNMPVNTFFTWDQVKRFRASNVFMMHSLLYRTEKLRQSRTVLPEHTFYEDNIYAYKPLPFMHRLYYLDIDLYRYFIGRADQSVNRENIVKRYRQQIDVTKIIVSSFAYGLIQEFPKGLKRYMLHHIAVVMILSLMFTTAGHDEVGVRKKELKDLWNFIKTTDKKMYRYLRHRAYPALISWMTFSVQGIVTSVGYRFFSRKIKCG